MIVSTRLGPSRICPCKLRSQTPTAFSVGGATVIESKGRGFKSHPGQSFSLSLCGPNYPILGVDPGWNNQQLFLESEWALSQ